MYQKIKQKIRSDDFKIIIHFQSYNNELGYLDLKETEKTVFELLNNPEIKTNLKFCEKICNAFKYCKKVKLKKYKLTFVFEK